MKLTRKSVVLLVLAVLLAMMNLVGGDASTAPAGALPSLSAFEVESVAAMQVSTPLEKLRIERVRADASAAEREEWRIVTPLQASADAMQVRALLRSFATGLPMDARVDDGDPANEDLHTNGFRISAWVSSDEIEVLP